MKLKDLWKITAPLACVLMWSAGWAQQQPGHQNPPEASERSAKSAVKEKHWSGSLVDVGCMAKTLGTETKGSAQTEPELVVPHLVGADPPSPQTAPLPGAPGQGGMGMGQRAQQPGPPTQTSSPDMNAAEQAQLDEVNRVENAAKVCAASPLTQALGLATPDGRVMQFDQDGNGKVKEALKNADVQSGKQVKAKVTGTMEEKNTVKVAAVEVKGKGK